MAAARPSAKRRPPARRGGKGSNGSSSSSRSSSSSKSAPGTKQTARARRDAQPSSSAPAGSGGRFKAMVSKLSKRGNVSNPKAVAAAIGRKKFGKAGMAKMSAAGRRRS